MSRSLAKLLKDSIELAEVQLDAARSLDHEALQEATDARSDLLFKLQALAPDGLDAAAQDERTRELALELAELDYRLNRILGAAHLRAPDPQAGRPRDLLGRRSPSWRDRMRGDLMDHRAIA